MQTPSPWATKADVEAAREALKADIAALHADLRAVKALLTDQQTRRSWWRRMFTAGAVVVAVIAVSAGARADFETGNTLYAECTSANTFDQALCLGYVAATADAARAPAPGGVLGFMWCGPDTVTRQQLADIVKRYLWAHPDIRHVAASELTAKALAGAFPCR